MEEKPISKMKKKPSKPKDPNHKVIRGIPLEEQIILNESNIYRMMEARDGYTMEINRQIEQLRRLRAEKKNTTTS